MALLEALLTAVVALFFLKVYESSSKRSSPPLPPGPKPDFLIGNLRDLPRHHRWIAFTEMGRKYGPMTFLRTLGQSFLVVNDQKVAIDLLDKMSSLTSRRPRLVMLNELCDAGYMTPILQPGPLFKTHRKLQNRALHQRIVTRDYMHIFQRFARRLTKTLLDDPDNLVNHIGRSTGEVIQTVTYGDLHDGDVDLVEICKLNADLASEAAAGGRLVEVLPIMKYLPEWFPGAGFKRHARLCRAAAKEALWTPFNMVKRQVVDGTAPPSFTLTQLTSLNDDERGNIDHYTIASVAAINFVGGSESIETTLRTFTLAMTLHPEVQKRAQAELDALSGGSLPTPSMEGSTPYLDAILLETLRWQPPVPTNFPHCSSEDITYAGYYIPRGTAVIVNIWGIMHDETLFPEPESFKPDRWLYDSGKLKANTDPPVDPWTVVFGYGRRICPGVAFARSSLWMTMATMLSTCDIVPKVDPETRIPLKPTVAFQGHSSVSPPEPFECDIKPRSASWRDRLTSSVEADSDPNAGHGV